MLGDGKTSYDHDHDNAANEIAGCSENFRRRDIPTKARLSYIKGKVLQVSAGRGVRRHSGVGTRCRVARVGAIWGGMAGG
jgi:hypothetical protein